MLLWKSTTLFFTGWRQAITFWNCLHLTSIICLQILKEIKSKYDDGRCALPHGLYQESRRICQKRRWKICLILLFCGILFLFLFLCNNLHANIGYRVEKVLVLPFLTIWLYSGNCRTEDSKNERPGFCGFPRHQQCIKFHQRNAGLPVLQKATGITKTKQSYKLSKSLFLYFTQ